ncbi:MAG TPA: hypothetical protein VG294_08610 [Solirubrobacteraceae bacterium]|nr:hypothetical protein [Solirubrobacteraceae bacterium]
MTARAAATAAGKRAAAQNREAKRVKAPTGVAKRMDAVRRSLAPAAPRRVSGPLHGRGAPPPGRSGAATARAPMPRAATTARATAAARPATTRPATTRPAAARPAAGARPATTARARGLAPTRGRAAAPATFRVAATARAAFSATAMAMAAAAEVAPRIVRPARPARDFPRPAPRIPSPARRAPVPATRGARALGFVRRLPDHSLTDRLVRGRAWIPVLGVLLVGIVAMQVSLLQLNASMGRAIEQGTLLQTKNGQLRAQVASLGAVSRIEGIAAGMGMVMASPSQMTFLSRHGGGIRGKAIANITAPSSSALATTQSIASTSAPSTTAATTAPSTSTPSTGTAAAPAPGTTATGTGAVSGAPQTGAGTGAPPPPASGTPSATGGTAATPVAAAPTGAAGLPPAAGGATGATTPSSGGASYSGTGG